MYSLFPLNEELALLCASVNTFAREKIAPRAAAIDTGNAFPRDLRPQPGVLGLLGITVEEECGGAGTSEIRRWLIGRELFEETTGDRHGRPD